MIRMPVRELGRELRRGLGWEVRRLKSFYEFNAYKRARTKGMD